MCHTCLRTFFDMHPKEEQSTMKFLWWVEDMRACYSISKEETQCHFLAHLCLDNLAQLDKLSDMCALLGTTNNKGRA